VTEAASARTAEKEILPLYLLEKTTTHAYHIGTVDRILQFAVDLALESGSVQKKRYQERHSITYKGEINIVTDVDIECQDRIISRIRRHFPDDLIIAEEKENLYEEHRNRWIVDPIDGTTNYAHGYPFFCTSIAYEVGGQVICGVVYNPIFEELFFAQKGKGAYLNGERLNVSGVGRMKQALLVTGFPYDLSTSSENNIDHFVAFLHHAQAVRRDGSAALNVSYLAAGRFDGYWELKLNPWDLAAGVLLLTEAGGTVTDFQGEPFDLYRGEICGSNGLLHGEMLRILKDGR
jgi:myo-inositol-1(or 4)-monophosphatase